jgi:hypothetical protein
MSRVTGHSARVKMRLILDGWEIRVDRLDPGFLLLREPAAGKPVEAKLVLKMDGVGRT